MPKHDAIPVDEVVLLQGVQHNGDGSVEQFRQSAVWIPAK